MSQYAPHLHVSDDGHIWWLRQDALRLGAGFLPVCDDNRQLEPRLQAPNQRALVNEKNLMAALGDARSKIPKPLTFERDGFRYVDAAGFLEWLSQYICQTQAKIEFPNDLSNEVRIALAKAAAERPPGASETFESLTLALEGEFDKSLDALPDALRHRVEKEFSPMPWDGLNSDDRRSVALQLDYQRDPATESDRQFWWDFFNKKGDLEKQIERWRAVAAPTAGDLAEKERRLKELADELARMERVMKHGRGDYLVEAPQVSGLDKQVGAEDFGFPGKADGQKLSVGSPEWRKRNAQAAADARHNKPGGSREKRDAIRAIWASGKYNSRDRCAEEECGALDMSFAAARNALKKQPKPQKKK